MTGAAQKSPPGTDYGPDYYEQYGRLGPVLYSRDNPQWFEFFGVIADELIRRINPRRVLDVGCAKGFLVECLRDRGAEAYGFDISEYAIREVRSDIKPYCWVASVSEPIKQDYDLIACIEVLEHAPAAEAHEAIRQMTAHTNTILFSSTPGNFEETTHINVHPIIDWLRLFAQFSFAPDKDFDTDYIAPQAMLLRRSPAPRSDQNLCLFADIKNRALAMVDARKQAEKESAAVITSLQRQLDIVLNSKGWKLLDKYRHLRAALRRPFAHDGKERP